jgi:hypothetical protein
MYGHKTSALEMWEWGYALDRAASTLRSLTSFCHHPHPEPLGDDWLTKVKANLSECIGLAITWTQKMGDRKTEAMLRKAHSKGLELAALLVDRPELSTLRFDQWPSESRRRVVEDIERCAAEIEGMVERIDQESESTDEIAPLPAQPVDAVNERPRPIRDLPGQPQNSVAPSRDQSEVRGAKANDDSSAAIEDFATIIDGISGPRRRQLIAFLWNLGRRPKRKRGDAIQHVYGSVKGNEDKFRDLVKEANKWLAELIDTRFRFQITCPGTLIQLVDQVQDFRGEK